MAFQLILTKKASIATVLAVEDTTRIYSRVCAVVGLVMSTHAFHVFEFTAAMVLWTPVVFFVKAE